MTKEDGLLVIKIRENGIRGLKTANSNRSLPVVFRSATEALKRLLVSSKQVLRYSLDTLPKKVIPDLVQSFSCDIDNGVGCTVKSALEVEEGKRIFWGFGQQAGKCLPRIGAAGLKGRVSVPI